MTELLQRQEIHVNEKNNEGYTALMFAAYKGDLQVLQELLKVEGINVNEKSNCGRTVLMNASRKGRLQVLQELLKVEGINVNETNNGGDTARDLAIEGRNELDPDDPNDAKHISNFNQIIAVLT